MKSYRRGVVIVLALLLGGLGVQAATEGQAAATRTQAYVQEPPSHWHEIDSDFMQSFHHPMEGLEMGLDLRLREVYARNILSLNDDFGGDEDWNEYHWQRYRMRWNTKWALSQDVDFNTRLTWEFWGHCDPENHHPGVSQEFFGIRDYEFDEAIFDHLNIQWRNAFDLPLTITIGRQDIILGTGWLVLDGTPADGSRTIFFDAVRAQYQVADDTKLDLIYIQQYDDENKWIEPFNHGAVENRRHLTQKQDERAFIAYLTSKYSDAMSQDLYYMYADLEDSDWSNNTDYTGTPGVSAEVHTIGTRLFGSLDENWSYSAEVAGQLGDQEGEDICALGSNNRLMYAFNDPQQNELHVGYEYLSGDDPSTDRVEQFNPLWGDWPQYQRGGDLQSYIWAFEGDGLGNVVNLHRFGVGHSFKPSEVWTVATDYNLFWADETNPRPLGPSGNSLTNSNFRGQMLSAIATYSCCKKFKTHFLVDYFITDDYYAISDNACFARINLEWTF